MSEASPFSEPACDDLIINGIHVTKTDDLQAIYPQLFAKHKASPEALLYVNPERHARKILDYARIIAGLLSKDPKLQFLDVGCAYGSLAEHIPADNYMGIDIIAEFVEAAKETYPDHRFEVTSLEDYTKQTDIALFSGFVHGVPQPFRSLQQGWDIADRGILVDFNDRDKTLAVKAPRPSYVRLYDRHEVEAQLSRQCTPNFTRFEGNLWNIYYLQK